MTTERFFHYAMYVFLAFCYLLFIVAIPAGACIVAVQRIRGYIAKLKHHTYHDGSIAHKAW